MVCVARMENFLYWCPNMIVLVVGNSTSFDTIRKFVRNTESSSVCDAKKKRDKKKKKRNVYSKWGASCASPFLSTYHFRIHWLYIVMYACTGITVFFVYENIYFPFENRVNRKLHALFALSIDSIGKFKHDFGFEYDWIRISRVVIFSIIQCKCNRAENHSK